MTKPIADLPASVHARLLNRSRESGEAHQSLLRRFLLERLLYRIAVTPDAERLVLKGAMLFLLWDGPSSRPTKDLDLGIAGTPTAGELAAMARGWCAAEVEPDGTTFDAASVRVIPIREGLAYHGHRVTLQASIGKTLLPIQVDIGYGDAVYPLPAIESFPTLLPFPAPRIRVYPREAVVAEKLHAAVTLGIANSRMKDFYDLDRLARTATYGGPTLVQSIRATFVRRQTAIPTSPPLALTLDFATDTAKRLLWQAFNRRLGIADPGDLTSTIEIIASLTAAPLAAAGVEGEFPRHWPPGGPWRPD